MRCSQPVLLETLDGYLVSGNAAAAAHRLGIHPQTMRYRLRRIRELTGGDPANGWDRFLLELALLSHALRDGSQAKNAPAIASPARDR